MRRIFVGGRCPGRSNDVSALQRNRSEARSSCVGPGTGQFRHYGSDVRDTHFRVTDQNTDSGNSLISTETGFKRTFNANSTAIKLSGVGGKGFWLEFNAAAFKVGDGTSRPSPHPLWFGSNWEWSAVDPDIIYFLNGNKIAKYNK